MKNIVRAFAFALVLTGAVASAHTASASTGKAVVSSKMGVMPVPMCAPGTTTNNCGMGDQVK